MQEVYSSIVENIHPCTQNFEFNFLFLNIACIGKNKDGLVAINFLYARGDISIWSADVSVQTRSTSVAQLLDQGNLVLFQDNRSESFIWQSFVYPTDTLLPGIKVGLTCRTERVRM